MGSKGAIPPTLDLADAKARLNQAGLKPGPNTGAGQSFMVWLCPKGFPEMIGFADPPACTRVWEQDVDDAIRSAKTKK